jgi:hypothetical protein
LSPPSPSPSLTNPLLLIALGLLIGGFAAINKFAPEPMQVGEHVVTQKSLYTAYVRRVARPATPPPCRRLAQRVESDFAFASPIAPSLFVIGIPLLWFSAPLSTFFWLVGSSIFLIGM